MARPSKITIDPTVADKIIRFVRAGNFKETAAVAAGVDPRTLRRWMAHGARGKEPYANFARKLEQASAESECMDIARIGAAGSKHWGALAWRLAHKRPDVWGDRSSLELSGPNGGAIAISSGVVVLPPVSDDDG